MAIVMDERDTDVGGVVWVQRAFLVMSALWLVVQGHLGSFLGRWDESHLVITHVPFDVSGGDSPEDGLEGIGA